MEIEICTNMHNTLLCGKTKSYTRWFSLVSLIFMLLAFSLNVHSTSVCSESYVDKYGWPTHEYPAKVVVKSKKAGVYVNSWEGPNYVFSRGDTLLVVKTGLIDQTREAGYVLDSGSRGMVPVSDCRYIGGIDEEELSIYNHIPFSLRWPLIAVCILCVLGIALFNLEQPWLATLASSVMMFLFYWYLKESDYTLWFVRPSFVGWIWTVVNGFLFMICGIFIWKLITHTFCFLGIDPITLICLKVAFVIEVYTNGGWENLTGVLLGIAFIATLISRRKYIGFVDVIALAVAYTFCWLFLNKGGQMCGREFHGWYYVLFLVTMFPQLIPDFENASSNVSSGSRDKWNEEHGTVHTSSDGSRYIVDGNGGHHWIWSEHESTALDNSNSEWHIYGNSAKRIKR